MTREHVALWSACVHVDIDADAEYESEFALKQKNRCDLSVLGCVPELHKNPDVVICAIGTSAGAE